MILRLAGKLYVYRGGAWDDHVRFARVAFRDGRGLSGRARFLGLRLLRMAP